MKLIKLFFVIVASAMTINMSAIVTAQATIKVASNGEGLYDIIYIYQDSETTQLKADFANTQNDYQVNVYATIGTDNYSSVRQADLNGLKFYFKANKYEADYTMSFSDVLGDMKLVRTGVDGEIMMNAPYSITGMTANEIVEFTIVMPQAALSHDRAVAAGSFGTICFPYEITAMEGVKDGKLLEFVTNGVTFVEAQEVELANMVKGKAYIFEASADAQSFTYNPESPVDDPIANNGLVGTFAEDGIVIEADAWIIKGSAIKAVLAGSSVPQYRAYIPSLDDIQTIPASGAPVRRFLIGEATGLQEIKAMEGTRKAIVNGRLVIIREGRMFNALGGRK